MRRARARGEAPVARRRHLILAGGGHAHAHVLRMLGARPLDGVRVTVVSPEPLAVYSGMVPGVLVGTYGPEDGRIDFAALAARAGAAFLRDRVVAIDPARRQVSTERCGALPYDVISLDVGSRPKGVELLDRCPHVVPVKPIEAAAARIGDFLESARAGRAAPRAVIVGGGAGGIEVAFGLRARLASLPDARVTVLEERSAPLPGASDRARARVCRLLGEYGVELQTRASDVRPTERGVRFRGEAGDVELEAALVVWSTGAEGIPWIAASGLEVDERGFLLVDAELRTIGHPEIFAAGDCAVQVDHRETPRAGVFAVRQGPVLERNLRAAFERRSSRAYVPQRHFLSLLSTGDRRAIALYRGAAFHGRAWWWLKDWIDRRFIGRYEPPRREALRAPPSTDASLPEAMAMAPCGGCAAKLDAATLAEMISVLDDSPARGVPIGLAALDDAAVLTAPAESDLVFTVDGFPAFLDDPFALGEIGAVNAVSDVYAMGGTPLGALVMVTAPAGDGAAARADLLATMRGAQSALSREGAPLLGGHSLAHGPLSIGFAVLGRVPRGAALTKGRALSGDRLIVTKALGTGVICAATRAGECPAAWTDGALASMRASNARAGHVLVAGGAIACTDVSGFGLVGHLNEMLAASGCGAEVTLELLPALPGARELLAAGWRSSAHEGNARALAAAELPSESGRVRVDLALACDPQTSGGLLAAIPAAALDSVLERFESAGVCAWVIGTVEARPGLRLRAATPRV
jgi:selenide, water dikinase